MTNTFKKVESNQETILLFRNLCTITVNFETLTIELLTSRGKMFFNKVEISPIRNSMRITLSSYKSNTFQSNDVFIILSDGQYHLDFSYGYFHVHFNAFKRLISTFNRFSMMKFLLNMDSKEIIFYESPECSYYAKKHNNIPTLFARITFPQKDPSVVNTIDIELKNFNVDFVSNQQSITRIVASGKKEIVINVINLRNTNTFFILNGFENLNSPMNSIDFYVFRFYNAYLSSDVIESIRVWNQLPIKSCPIMERD